ncbi:MAG: tetratricopeptide repeat protein, partial [Proteobacteria bacterium]|nr:tetratricopeptide repeat protein [Pseudomonadota bacterium]
MNGRFLCLVMLFWSFVASADPSVDALSPIVRNIYTEGLGLEKEREYRRAAIRFRKVLELDPGWTRAALDLGRVLEANGQPDEAEQAYWLAPSDTGAVEALGKLYLSQQRYDPAVDAFRILQSLAPADTNAIRLEVLALAMVNATEGELRFREYLELSEIEVSSVEVADAAVVVSDALEEAGEEDTARTLLEDLRDAQGEEAEAAELYSERL